MRARVNRSVRLHSIPQWTFIAASLIMALGQGPQEAAAEERTLAPQLFRPSVDGLGLAVLEVPAMPEDGAFSVALFGSLANRPLQWRIDGRHEAIIDQMRGLDLTGAYAIHRWIAVGAHVPAYQHALPDAVETTSGLGDVALWGKGAMLTELGGPFSLSAAGRIKFPSGDSAEFRGDGTWAGELTGLIGRSFGPFQVVGNLGYRIRSRPIAYASMAFRDEVLMGIGMAVSESSRRYSLEVHGSTPADDSFQSEQTPLEALAGIRQAFGKRLLLDAGAGRGIGRGYASPSFRAFLGVRLLFPAKGDQAP